MILLVAAKNQRLDRLEAFCEADFVIFACRNCCASSPECGLYGKAFLFQAKWRCFAL